MSHVYSSIHSRRLIHNIFYTGKVANSVIVVPLGTYCRTFSQRYDRSFLFTFSQSEVVIANSSSDLPCHPINHHIVVSDPNVIASMVQTIWCYAPTICNGTCSCIEISYVQYGIVKARAVFVRPCQMFGYLLPWYLCTFS